MKYVHLFSTNEQYSEKRTNDYYEPWVSYTDENEQVNYNKPDASNEYPYADLGLSSGTLWATCNLGATSPEEYGDYYAWGEIETKDVTAYTQQGYRFYPGNDSDEYTKYNSTDNKMTLDLEDDVAHVVMGGDWHMPSSAQLNELTANTTSSWTTDYNGTGVSGVVFTSNINGNSIFFPAAGVRFDGAADGHGDHFAIWSSSRDSDSSYARNLDGDAYGRYMSNGYRDAGLSVRGVLGETQVA